jgi:hypothetical protein
MSSCGRFALWQDDVSACQEVRMHRRFGLIRRGSRMRVLSLAVIAGCTGSIGPAGEGGRNGSGGAPPGQLPPGVGEARGELAPTTLRRLTRAQYNNTVRDLLGMGGDVAAGFGLDEDEGGFSANARAPIKELQLEKYREAAEALAIEAVAALPRLAPCTPPARPEAECLDEFLRGFGKRAYRRPLTAEESARYRALFAVGREGADFAAGIGLVVGTMLQSPHFLYRPELGDPTRAGKEGLPLDPYETASRLSYYLQNTMPDQELFAAAEAGRLATAEQVAAQARRLLASPRARDSVVSFYLQWLQVDDLLTVEKDPEVYPTFTAEVRAAMRDEIEEFVDQIARRTDAGGGTLEALLTSRVSFLRGPLFGLYGVDAGAGTGAGLRRTELPEGQRAGVLTLAGVMAKHGHPDQSSPVARGYVISDRLLCVVPPEPPQDVDAAVPRPDPNVPTRVRFEQHRSKPQCAACHALMDPLGLAFEAYDGIGRFRSTDGRAPVDSTSELRGTDQDGPVKDAVEMVGRLARTREVRACMARQWFRYALGRLDSAGDEPAIAAAIDAFARDGHRLPDLMVALAASHPFRFRRPVDLP